MSKKEEQFNLEEIKKKALEQFRSGKSLYGKDGAFAPMLKSFLESALEGELDSHLDEEERNEGNRKNGDSNLSTWSCPHCNISNYDSNKLIDTVYFTDPLKNFF